MVSAKCRFVLFVVVVLTSIQGVATAFVLDTPVVFDSTHQAYCVFYNRHPTKTCTFDSSSGMYMYNPYPPINLSPTYTMFPVTVPPGDIAFSAPPGVASAPNGAMCHFDVSGCPKGKVRAVLSLDGGAVIPAN